MVEQHRVKVGGDADVARARRAAHAALDGRSDDCVYSAELIVSELVTNALLHGGGSAQLTVLPIQDGARIEVSDGNRNTPLVGVATADAMTGRGLHLVARLAARWGVDPTEAGKVVWAEVVDAPRHRIEPSEEDLFAAWADSFDSELEDLRVRVSLGHVPTGLLVAAKRHIDNLVREFTLAAGGGRSRTTAPVPVALAELIDRVVHRFEDARLEIKRQATAAARAGSSHTFLELDLPVDAADAAEQYVEALDEADEYCRANRVLTLETPPQHRLFRRWYTGEIVKQLRAVQAGRARPEVMPFEQRLLEEVDNADLARRRAE
ncbi:MAG: hypothetical protein QOG64_2989, partial [Acidimicrobiaceae bacterium]|nr:hypothetical protein [Acidimicrobiaceae bacterium]